MKLFIYEFRVLEPITYDKEFSKKVTNQLYPTIASLFSYKRLIAAGMIATMVEKGEFAEVGDYRFEMQIQGKMTHANIKRMD